MVRGAEEHEPYACSTWVHLLLHAVRCAHLTVPWLRCRCLVTVSLLAALLVASSASEDNVDLPVATEGTKEWVALVAQAMSLGGRDREQSLQALDSFQSSTMAKLQKRVTSLLSTRTPALEV